MRDSLYFARDGSEYDDWLQPFVVITGCRRGLFFKCRIRVQASSRRLSYFSKTVGSQQQAFSEIQHRIRNSINSLNTM